MSVSPNHSLMSELPHKREQIIALKATDPDFAKLADEYHRLDHQVRGLEACKVPTTDEHFDALKRRRVMLKDLLYAKLGA